uniref:E3 ubiquitin-protein ligase HERC2-like n=1 Tax=Ciona intestinalis TaxID=7719 RepID=UPI00089DCF20|nr:E3 ubiquitin-protein ligase HERC2-like [Ciona intestinalis]|eukprot:XP_018671040.1 E3 ubiquitin-protein ligase HERC2-like [Ciona intestinalis]
MMDLDLCRCFLHNIPPQHKWALINLQDLEDEGTIENSWYQLLDERAIGFDESNNLNTPPDPRVVDWGKQPDVSSLKQQMQSLQNEQLRLCYASALTAPSVSRITKQVFIATYHYRAVAGSFGNSNKADKNVTNDVVSSDSSHAVERKPVRNPLDKLRNIGSRYILSFAFSYLRRAWRTGEDTDLCTELLQDSLDSFREFEPGSLFDQSQLTPTWLDILERSEKFLRSVAGCPSTRGNIPLTDQRVALNLLLELSIQRGRLGGLLDVIAYLLNLWESKMLPDNMVEYLFE